MRSRVVALASGSLVVFAAGCGTSSRHSEVAVAPARVDQPRVGSRKAPPLVVSGKSFRDANRSGTLEPYEDWRLPVERRIDDLLARMTIEEKAGLMMHATFSGFEGPNGTLLDAPVRPPPPLPNVPYIRDGEPLDDPPASVLVKTRGVRWMLLRPIPFARPSAGARFTNALQELAEDTRLGIPMVFSSDPRHTRREFPNTPRDPRPGNISRWPFPIGLAALGPDSVAAFARVAAAEYRAIGLHVALSPSADLATEPRWNRIQFTFGEDVELVSRATEAFVRASQGESLGPGSVLTITKHYPGSGPLAKGFDSHNHYGKHQVYPGGRLALHERPFRTAVRAGTGGIMTGYGIVDGVDDVGASFSERIVGEGIRKRLGFDGLVMSDWVHPMPWGVERFSLRERERRLVVAGCDQLGGFNDPKHVLSLVRSGEITAARVEQSARRVLRPMFQLGLFENPYVDEDLADRVVASEDFVRQGRIAQAASMVVLKNAGHVLPLREGSKVYVVRLAPDAVPSNLVAVGRPEDADVIVVKIDAPYRLRRDGTQFFSVTKEKSVSFDDADNLDELRTIEAMAAHGKPVVVAMLTDRPVVVSHVLSTSAALVAHFGSDDEAIFDGLTGKVAPKGRLPFDLPSDAASVDAQLEDVPFDFPRVSFHHGFGSSYDVKP